MKRSVSKTHCGEHVCAYAHGSLMCFKSEKTEQWVREEWS